MGFIRVLQSMKRYGGFRGWELRVRGLFGGIRAKIHRVEIYTNAIYIYVYVLYIIYAYINMNIVNIIA